MSPKTTRIPETRVQNETTRNPTQETMAEYDTGPGSRGRRSSNSDGSTLGALSKGSGDRQSFQPSHNPDPISPRVPNPTTNRDTHRRDTTGKGGPERRVSDVTLLSLTGNVSDPLRIVATHGSVGYDQGHDPFVASLWVGPPLLRPHDRRTFNGSR